MSSELIKRIRQNVPQMLRDSPTWLLHDQVKVPIYANAANRHGDLDTPEDRSKLVTFEEAAAALARERRASGLGIALGEVPGEEIRISGIDVDACYRGAQLDERAMQILGAANSYAERSPSGTGLHVLGTGDIGTLKLPSTADRPGLELYSGQRYFTVTGDRLNGAHVADITEAASLARQLFAQEPARSPEAAHQGEQDNDITEALKRTGLYLRDSGSGKHLIRCPWEARHSPNEDGSRQTSSSEAAYFAPGAIVRGQALESGMFKCQHAHCGDRRLKHLREYLGIECEWTEPAEQPAQTVTRKPSIIWSELEGREPPAREWVIPHWVPHRHTTLLAGRGGIGKTLLAQHIATALALGQEYMEPLEARRVLMWAGEDDEAELWRRQVNICSWMLQPLSDLTERYWMHSYAGDDITLLAPVFGALTPTPMLTELRQQVQDYRAEVVILDNIARLYGGNENDRHGVTTFCALVQGACAPAAVILLGHPAKAEGSEYSGSTAWEGAVRARLYLSDRPPDQDEDDDTPVDDRVRYVSRRKANYSALDVRRMALMDGVLIPAVTDPARPASPRGEFLRDVVRRAVRILAERDVYGSESDRAGNYLPRLARKYRLLETATEKTFAGAMREMILAGELETREMGRDRARRVRVGLALSEATS